MRTGTLVHFGLITLGLWASATAAEDARFRAAKPIWPKDREREMNLLVGFRAVIEPPAGENVVLQVAAATIYRAWINGQFLGCGPARGPHGYFRVDQWDLSHKLQPGKNVIALEVAGYNANSYYLLDQPSFLQAEVVADDRVLVSTGGVGEQFSSRMLDYRVQKVQRYSFQRPFTEVYRLTPDFDRWRRETADSAAAVTVAVLPEKDLLPRRVRYPQFAEQRPLRIIAAGRVEPIKKPKDLWKDRSLANIGPKLKGFPERELATIPSIEAQCWRSVRMAALAQPYSGAAPVALAAHQYRILDLGVNRTGFIGARVTCAEKARLWFLFDEIITGNDVDFKRLGCVNIVSYELEPGTYRIESIEPYTFRYLKLLCLEGSCEVEKVRLREYAHPPVEPQFAASDPRLNRIFAAGVETFRQNALDIFMDCPSRERAGWLCDSFFTSRVAVDLSGDTLVERNFMENFLLPAKFAFLPDGMLPMCYPADHNDGVYIPNWALWFVAQLEEYSARSGDRATVEALRPRVLKLFDFFKRYENQDGLLEKLPSWVFVEWSAAADFVQDVNYPSNMLYAGVLSAAGRMYHLPELTAKAERIQEAIRRQSFDGHFFVDNAVRHKNGKLEVTRNRTEVCQYYAFFFQVATPESHPDLWRVLRDKFGPDRKKTKEFSDVHQANSFIGNMLRMELLSQAGLSRQILKESISYLLYMADRTGTLWENTEASASCDHGFASHIVHTLYRDILGIRHVDRLARRVAIQFGDVPLDYCEGTLPTPDGPLRLHWRKTADRIEYRLRVPAGYQVTITNRSGKELSAK
jgi:alpha-L-rhamnosidase